MQKRMRTVMYIVQGNMKKRVMSINIIWERIQIVNK